MTKNQNSKQYDLEERTLNFAKEEKSRGIFLNLELGIWSFYRVVAES